MASTNDQYLNSSETKLWVGYVTAMAGDTHPYVTQHVIQVLASDRESALSKVEHDLTLEFGQLHNMVGHIAPVPLSKLCAALPAHTHCQDIQNEDNAHEIQTPIVSTEHDEETEPPKRHKRAYHKRTE